MAVLLGSARINENGKVSGGKAGDQTGKEVSTQSFYVHRKGWTVIRAKDANTREIIARTMEQACNNANIGYCQSHRYTLTNEAAKYNYDVSRVNKPVETDCSELVRVCCLAAGVKVPAFTTRNEVGVLQGTGRFDILRDSKYTTKDTYLMRGDILDTESGGHTVVVLSNGSGVSSNSSTPTPAPTPVNTNTNSSKFNQHLKDLQGAIKADGIYSFPKYGCDGEFGAETDKGLSKVILSKSSCRVNGQWRYVNTTAWVQCRIGAGIDGKFGNGTYEKVVAYQQSHGLSVDGVVGKNTLKSLLRDMGVKC